MEEIAVNTCLRKDRCTDRRLVHRTAIEPARNYALLNTLSASLSRLET